MKYLPRPLYVGCAVTAITLVWACYLGFTARKYISVPAELCASQYTGRAKVEQEYYYTCTAYNKDMQCTAQIPNFYDVSYGEVHTTCDFVEWRRK